DPYTVRKLLPDGSYTAVAGAENLGQLIDGEVVFLVRYSITDGGELDDDGTLNGVIVDPSGAALRVEQDTDVTSDDTTADSLQLADTGTNTVSIALAAVLLLSPAAMLAGQKYRQFRR